MTVHERYAYRNPDCFTDHDDAPQKCAGSVPYRALKLTRLHNGDLPGLTGFGASGHLVLQLARRLWQEKELIARHGGGN